MIWFPKSGYCSLKMYKISNQIVQFIKKTLQTWRVELTAGGQNLAEVKSEDAYSITICDSHDATQLHP